jgi:hypothetical protein
MMAEGGAYVPPTRLIPLLSHRAIPPCGTANAASDDAAAVNLTLMGQTPAPTPAFSDRPKRTPCLLTSGRT